MKKMPLVSIVIPTYNRRYSALRLIDSIQKSTYKNIEVIVIDDYSNDDTSNFLKSKVKSSKVKIYRNKKNYTGNFEMAACPACREKKSAGIRTDRGGVLNRSEQLVLPRREYIVG